MEGCSRVTVRQNLQHPSSRQIGEDEDLLRTAGRTAPQSNARLSTAASFTIWVTLSLQTRACALVCSYKL